jgi:hypothetical protein
MSFVHIHIAGSKLTFRDVIPCTLNPNVRLRLVSKKDFAPLFRIIGSDPEGWREFSGGLTVKNARDLEDLLSFYREEDKILPYVVETSDDNKRYTIVGLTSFDFWYKKDFEQRSEIYTSLLLAKSSRKTGIQQAVTHTRLKTLLDMGVTPARSVGIHNAPSWKACEHTGRLDRKLTEGGQTRGIFVVTKTEWPKIEKKLQELYAQKRTR